MELSMFLAKLIGMYFLIIAMIWICRRREFEMGIQNTLSSPGVLVTQGIITLLLGLAIVIDHTIIAFNWQGLITLIGYLLIIKGIVRLAFQKYEKKIAFFLLSHRLYVICILIIVGLFLTINGFIQ